MPVSQSLPALFLPSERTVPEMLLRQAERYAEGPVITIGGRTFPLISSWPRPSHWRPRSPTRGSWRNRVPISAHPLLGSPSSAHRLAAIAVPINTATRGAQLEHILANCGARLMVIERELSPRSLRSIPRALRLRPYGWWARGRRRICRCFPPFHSRTRRRRSRRTVGAGRHLRDPLHSGTTGLSKGVCCPHAQYFWWAVYTGGSSACAKATCW